MANDYNDLSTAALLYGRNPYAPAPLPTTFAPPGLLGGGSAGGGFGGGGGLLGGGGGGGFGPNGSLGGGGGGMNPQSLMLAGRGLSMLGNYGKGLFGGGGAGPGLFDKAYGLWNSGSDFTGPGGAFDVGSATNGAGWGDIYNFDNGTDFTSLFGGSGDLMGGMDWGGLGTYGGDYASLLADGSIAL